jgi:hypothetical protein
MAPRKTGPLSQRRITRTLQANRQYSITKQLCLNGNCSGYRTEYYGSGSSALSFGMLLIRRRSGSPGWLRAADVTPNRRQQTGPGWLEVSESHLPQISMPGAKLDLHHAGIHALSRLRTCLYALGVGLDLQRLAKFRPSDLGKEAGKRALLPQAAS